MPRPLLHDITLAFGVTPLLFPTRIRCIRDRAVEPYRRARCRIGQRHRNRLLVSVQAYEKRKICHGRPRSVPGDRLLRRGNPRSVAKRLTRHFEADRLNRLTRHT
jgi:hypothetical protein